MDTTRKQAAWLICMAMVVAAGGCAGCPVRPEPGPTEPVPGGSTSGGVVVSGVLPVGCTDPANDCEVAQTSLTGECTTGDCKPGGLNGKGIYNVEEANYCFLFMGSPRFCPETFVNSVEGVVLVVRDLLSPRSTYQRFVTATLQSKPIVLRSITSEKGDLIITYAFDKNGKDVIAKGAALKTLMLRVGPYQTGSGDASPLATFEMQVIPYNKQDGVLQYQLQYREVAPVDKPAYPWLYHCKGEKQEPEKASDDAVVSFLDQRRVSGLNAYVTADAKATTVACQKGAIATCLRWGYAPWSPTPGTPERSEYAYGSCLQGKRAAYFVRFGDYTTYTKNGTHIQMRDQFGINANDVDYLEAIWSPGGAVCLNVENVRRDEFRATVDSLNGKGFKVPPCAKPPQWSKEGKFATGPQKAPTP